MKPHMFAALSLALFASCKSEAKPSGKIEDVVEARATITAVNLPQRQLTLKDDDGTEVVVVASAAVKNLDQIHPGDQVAVSYTESISWQSKSADMGTPGVTAGVTAAAAKAGEKPEGKVGRSVAVTVTITGIDMAAGRVTLTGPAGKSLTFVPRDPENLKKVKVGDLIDITYSEALAVAVRPVEKKK